MSFRFRRLIAENSIYLDISTTLHLQTAALTASLNLTHASFRRSRVSVPGGATAVRIEARLLSDAQSVKDERAVGSRFSRSLHATSEVPAGTLILR